MFFTTANDTISASGAYLNLMPDCTDETLSLTSVSSQPKRPPLRVLVVDDAAPVRRVLTALLANIPGVTVAGEAADVTEGINAVRALEPDVVILDLTMPGGSGVDVLIVAKHQPQPPVAVIFTAFDEPHLRERCLHAGADFFFAKATGTEELFNTIRSLADAADGQSETSSPAAVLPASHPEDSRSN